MIRELFAGVGVGSELVPAAAARRRAGRRGGPAGPLRFEGLEGRWTPAALPAGCHRGHGCLRAIGSTTALANAARAVTSVMGGPWLYDEEGVFSRSRARLPRRSRGTP